MKPKTPKPINEAALAETFTAKVTQAKQSGPVMTPEEFKAWLNQH